MKLLPAPQTICKTFSAAIVCISLQIGSLHSALAETIISINFEGGRTTPCCGGAGSAQVSTVAGYFQADSWNNFANELEFDPQNLVDSKGAPISATLTYTSPNNWAATAAAPGDGSDGDMMSGYLDNLQNGGDITVDSLGPEFTTNGYSVIVYHSSDSAGTPGFEIDGTALYLLQEGAGGTNYPLEGDEAVNGYILSRAEDPADATASNAVIFEGLTSESFTIIGVAGDAGNRPRPNGIQIIGTSLLVDEDDDGLDDGWEEDNGLDPTDGGETDVNNGAEGDPDGDSLSNLEEFELGTKPNDADTDDDGLEDNVEDKGGVFVSAEQTGSHPLKADTDGDGLSDGGEVAANPYSSDPNKTDTDGDSLSDDSEMAANPFVTNPSNPDTDGDTFSDATEILLGSDPTDGDDTPEVGADTVISINFEGGQLNPCCGGGGSAQVTTVAGYVPADHWNNFENELEVDPQILVGSSGESVTATLTYTSPNNWASTGAAPGDGGDGDMMSGYLDNLQTGGDITVEGLDATFTANGYSVIVYHSSDSAGAPGFDIDGTSLFLRQEAGGGSNYPLDGPDAVNGYILSTATDAATAQASNGVLFENLTSPSFTITGVAGTGGNRPRPNGIQIIANIPITDGDGDGLDDDWEEANDFDPNDDGSTNPVNGANGDPDGDTLSNLDEFKLGTNPRAADSDDDGLNDNVEDKTGVFVDATKTGSHPLRPDSDGDGLKDGDEVVANPFVSDPNKVDTDGDGLTDDSELAANPFTTNPSKSDTDGDGASDPNEIELGSDPTDAASLPVLAADTLISINFEGGQLNPCCGGGGSAQVTEVAGFVAADNWNNFERQAEAIPQVLLGSSGAGVSATLTYSSPNNWAATGAAPGDGADGDMMSGYLDNLHSNGFIEVSGLGEQFTKGGYDVIVYHSSDSAGTPGFDIDGTSLYLLQEGAGGSNYPLDGDDSVNGYILSRATDPADALPSNAVIFEGLTSPTFTVTGIDGADGNRPRPNGIQIVGKGPVNPFTIVSISRVADKVTLTWGSSSDRVYAVESSLDLDTWLEVDDGIDSEGAETSWTGTVDAGTSVIYYRVQEIQ
ncbi:MAG: hypothetical protein KDN22_21110 [Verrucomicrobiae bacterium]|nr:hypothetical protein [Verrucomicrobiae bacterium]